MDIEIERKDYKTAFLKNKVGVPDCKVIEEMNGLGRNKISSKRKSDRSMDRLHKSVNNHKYNKNKKH